ncbi:MAG: pyrroline-5-carboxylate reductase [Clostridiales bacterium]|nr:pyrroline-5-carboxylate reductase [Clostridiales bacterium]
MYQLGIIGTGNMGMAILNGAISSGSVKGSDIAIFDLSEEKQKICSEKGCTVLSDEGEVFQNSSILLLAIKPQNFEALMTKLSALQPAKGQIIVTIAAGISTGYIQSYLNQNKKLIRVMPNTPLLINKGAVFLSKTDDVTEGEFEKVNKIFQSMGTTAVISEDKMNEVIPVNGSSPAYVYYFIDAIAKSAEKMGIDFNTALKLTALTFIGSAEMILKSGMTPEELIRQVCSPGGATLESIKVFDEHSLYDIIDEACVKCVKRAYEIGK